MSIKKSPIDSLYLKDLHPFAEHPFEVRDDEAMKEMVESIKESGVLTPITVRSDENGGYEIISGHRRAHACELAGKKKIPAIIRNCTRDEAIIMMVDSNLQRETILPSEKAKAYKMKLEALKRQGKRTDLETVDNQGSATSPQVGEKLKKDNYSISKVAKDANESATKVQRYIRLTELHPDIQKKVDNKDMGITPAVEISYLTPHEQELLVETMESEDCTPSLSQAQRMRKMSKEGTLNEDTMLEMMMEQKKPEQQRIVLTPEKLSKYFPRGYTSEEVEEVVFKLLENWHRKVMERKQQLDSQKKQPAPSKPQKKKSGPSL